MIDLVDPHPQTILSTTLVIVLFTVVVFGGGTMAVLQRLKIRVHVSDDEQDDAEYMLPDGTRAKPAKGWFARHWQGMDQRCIKPVLSHTPDNWGTDTSTAVRQTVSNWWHGIPETPPRLDWITPLYA